MRPLVACAAALMLACAPATPGANAASGTGAEPFAGPACTSEEVAAAMPGLTPLHGRVIPGQEALELPASWLQTVYGTIASRVQPDSGLAGGRTRIGFTLRSGGRSAEFRILSSSGPARLTRDAYAAVAGALLMGAMPAIPGARSGSDVPLVLEVRDGQPAPDWLPYPVELAFCVAPPSNPRVCESPFIRRFTMADRGNRAPPYPLAMRERALSDTVLLSFVVGADGRADPSTAVPLEFNHREFLEAVVAHLPTMRYLPAMLDDCRAPMWVTQPFMFSLAGTSRPGPPGPEDQMPRVHDR